MTKMRYAALLLVGLAAPFCSGATTGTTQRTVMHFADLGGIKNWRPVDGKTDGLLIEGRNDHWYRATFWAPCPEVHYALAIAFVTEPDGSLDQFGSVLVDGDRCHFKTFERTEAPG